MAQLMDYANYLAKEIGPRPAGHEEERQAALYITEQFQKEAGFSAAIEDFTSSSNLEGGRAVLAGVTIVVSILAMIFPVLTIFAFVLAAAAAALYTLEALDRPIISNRLSNRESQNIVAKYQPNPDAEASGRVRSRKLILVAHYDTGRVKPGFLARLESTGLPLTLICFVAMIAAAVLLLLRVFIATAGGGLLVILNVLTVIALIICALPIVKALMMRTAPFNEGANNNATGAAALIEVARRISRGSVSEADLANGEDGDVVVHGEEAARSAGLVPEGAQIVYEAEQIAPQVELGEYDEEERLLAAKAAIAALTGKPVERKVYGSVADNLVNSRAHEAAPAEGYDAGEGYDEAAAGGYAEPADQVVAPAPARDYAEQHSAVNEPVPAEPAPQVAPQPESQAAEAEGFENAPSWFIAAQQNAKRSASPADDQGEIHRSRYTEAMEHGARVRQEREQAEAQAEQERLAAEARAREEQASAAAASLAESFRADAEPQGRDAVAAPAADASGQEAGTQEGGAREQAAPSSSGFRSRPRFEPAFEEADFPDDPILEAAYERGLRDAQLAQQLGEEPTPVPARDAQVAQPQDDPFVGAAVAGFDAAEVSDPLDPASTRAFPGYAAIDAAQSAAAQEAGAASAGARPRARHAIDLPEVGQAPAARHAQVADLPAIGSDSAAQAQPGAVDSSREDKLRNLRTNVPSLSGVIRSKSETRKAVASSLPSVVSVPTPIEDEAPVELRPIAEEELRAPAPRRASVSGDAVDYDMEVPVGLEGEDAPEAAPARSSIPRRRADGFLDRFRQKDDDLEGTPQEWLDVDDDFDARSVGKARGGWESFRNDDEFADDDFGDFGTGDERPRNSRWEGGAYSRMQLGHVDMRSGEDAEADEVIPDELPEDEVDRFITGEIEQIYHFRNPSFNTEIWFVAIGSDTESHDGAKAFLEEHRNELRGSMIIEVESLGAGELSVASQEGALRKVKASSRIKRLTRDAVAKTGISLDEVSLAGTDSISSTIQKAGFQSMHLFGAEDGRPAMKGSADDVMENVDEALFDENVNFIYELLKSR